MPVDWEQMRADLEAIRADNEEYIVIRRGDETLEPQAARIARKGSAASERDSTGAQQSVGQVVVLGALDMDIRVGDRFTDANGLLYRVVFVRPNRRAATMAEAVAIE